MKNLKLIPRIKELYDQGHNIIQYLKSLENKKNTSVEDILISYDFQAGVYTARSEINRVIRNQYCNNLKNEIESLGDINSILEVGVGEASTLGNLLIQLDRLPNDIYGFDLSWSRLKYAKIFLSSLNLDFDVNLCTGDLFSSPFPDNSFDLVYTSHTLEPNGGSETNALKELFRITKKYLILLEPAYELANEKARERMDNHGYVKNLSQTIRDLGYEIVKHELFEPTFNPLNPTGITIIKKSPKQESKCTFACPLTKTPLSVIDNSLFSKESLLAYPILKGIPCLLPSNSILATHLLD